ncbi:MAG: serine hydroxymethyltransferase [Patescibacteria group bacterium]
MDTKLKKLVNAEIKRQEDTLDFIASENIASPEMLQLLGSPLTNKYSEGYPGKRYYPGNQYYDDIELLAGQNALTAFKLSPKQWAVNVQPYSGSPANHAVYLALAKPGDTIMGLELSHGGHLTHGHRVSFSGIYYRSISYGVDIATGRIDYDALLHAAKEYRPRIIISGGSAYPRSIHFKHIGSIAKSVGAYHVADISHIAGLVAAGVHESPFPHAHVVTTTTHKTLRGPRGAVIFSRLSKVSSEGGKNSEMTISAAIDKAVFPGLQGGPHNSTIAAIAWMFKEVQKPVFTTYIKQVCANATALALELKKFGFLIATEGTDNHLFLLDVRPLAMNGKDAEALLETAYILANRNTLAGDKSPQYPSGVRFGTPSITTRGMKEREMKKIALCIKRVLMDGENPRGVGNEVKKIASQFPLPYRALD